MTACLLALPALCWAAWTDTTRRVIPDGCVLAVLGCGLLRVLWGFPVGEAALGLLALGLPVLFCAMLSANSGGVGGGDVKLCAALGALLGAMAGLITVAAALACLVCCGRLRHREVMPLAPFLLCAYVLTLILMWR